MTKPETLIELIRKASEDDRLALGALLQHYRPFLNVYVARQITGLKTRTSADDVVQEVNAIVCREFSFAGKTEAEFTTWIYTIARNTIASLFRKHGALMRNLDRERRMCDATGSASVGWIEPAADESTPSQKFVKGEDALRLLACIADLPEDQRDAVRLRHLDGLTTDEICKVMDRTSAAVAGLLQRGLRNLRQLLSDESR